MSTTTKIGGPSILKDESLGHRTGDIVDIRHIDGKGSLTITAKETVKLLKASVQLAEIPDATGDTFTVVITDGTNDITDTITFTEGSDAKGATSDFVLDATYWEIRKGSSIVLTTAGTTTTKGEVLVNMVFQRQ